MLLNIFRIYFDDIPEISKFFRSFFDYNGLKQFINKNQKFKTTLWNKIKDVKILDPSCGTGRFLISIAIIFFELYNILEHNLTEYEIKKKIIQDHINGIEIDRLSYHVSKLRLIKWLYEDEIVPINHNLSEFPQSEEIEDFINDVDLDFNLFNQEYLVEYEGEKVDIIIGNPPYVENKKIRDKDFKIKIKEKFESAYKLYDLSVIFIEKSLNLLKKDVGCLTFITTNKLLSADYGVKIREILLRNTEIREIMNISSLPIFKNTAAYPIILVFKKKKNNANMISIKNFDSIEEIEKNTCKSITQFPQNSIYNFPSKVIPLTDKIDVIEKIYSKYSILSKAFDDLKIIYRPFGFIKWSKNSKYVKEHSKSTNDLLLLSTGNVGRYFIDFNKKIKVGKNRYQHPYIQYKEEYSEVWKELSQEKLIFREIAKNLTFAYDPGVFANLTGLYFLKIPSLTTDQLFSLLGILNSNLVNQIFKSLYGTLHMSGGYLRVNGSFIKKLAVPNYLPESLSNISRIIHFLTQIRYEFLQKFLPPNNKVKLKRIERYIKFYESLSNSIVNQLYFDIQKKNVNFDAKDIPRIDFKFIKTYYSFPRFKIYSNEEFFHNLKKIAIFYDLYNHDLKKLS
jgi:hypothetical protein